MSDEHSKTEATLSTHVLDTARGRPAQGLGIVLERLEAGTSPKDGSWETIAAVSTNDDGRVPEWPFTTLALGTYRITFDTETWFEKEGTPPFVVVSV